LSDFWVALDNLLAMSPVVIDRPRGRAHPKIPTLVYPLDYGYVEGTSAMDGEGIDVWIGSDGTRDLVAVACTYDRGKRDAEVKLLLGCTADDIRLISSFNPDFMCYQVTWRPTAQS
jgi:inorganic pyrophosphatase